MKNIIELQHLIFHYGRLLAIDDISLQIGPGIHGLLGPNGAGKTTLMKILLGFLRPAAGSGQILGCDILSHDLAIRRLIGYVPENDCLLPGMDAVTLTAYLGELSGMPRQEAIKRAHDVLYYVGLGEARYRLAATYSTGMKQRLKLATALVHDPKLLFLDEPTSGMDPQARSEMLALIQDIAAKKTMDIVLSSHILADIENTCSHVLIMHQGKIVTQQRIENLRRERYDVFELKLTGPVDNFIARIGDCRIEKNDNGRYRLQLPSGFQTKTIFAAAVATKVQIRHFKKSRSTLEEAFIAAIGEKNAD